MLELVFPIVHLYAILGVDFLNCSNKNLNRDCDLFPYLFYIINFLCSCVRSYSTIRAEGAQGTGTACLGSNTWPQDTTWLQRSARLQPPFVCLSVSLTARLCKNYQGKFMKAGEEGECSKKRTHFYFCCGFRPLNSNM